MNLKKQIIFSDYDGTIYINEDEMPQNIKAIEEYRNLGGKFIIVTGRSKVSISKVIKQYSIPYDYIITNNGAVIFNRDMNKIDEQAIKINISNRIIEYLNKQENIEIFYYDDEDKVKYNNQKLLKIRVKTTDHNLAEVIENYINTNFNDDVSAHLELPGVYYDDIDYALVDIVSKKAGKENAIKKLLEVLDVKCEQIVTVGDGRNDIGMISQYNGYSIETAKEEVKKFASKVFKNIAEIVEYLKM